MYRFLLRYIGIVAVLFFALRLSGQTVLMHEGFESGALPVGWTQVYTSDSNADWLFQNGGYSYSSASFEYEKTPSDAFSGSYNAVFHSSVSSETMLVSPLFDLSGGDITKLEYQHAQGCFFNQALNVYYREGINGPWSLLRSNNEVVFSWRKDSLIVPSVADSVYFAFQAIWDGGCGVCLDDVILLRLKPYTAKFVVKDAQGAPIQGAIVTFNEVAKITDAAGVVLFSKVYEGRGFAYNVRKSGYAPESGKINIEADVLRSVTLLPSRILYVSTAPKTVARNGSNWDSAYVSVADALADAKKGDQIWISKGVYYPSKQWNVSSPRAYSFAMKKELAIFGGFEGISGTEGNLASQNVDTYKTVFSGDIDKNDNIDEFGITTSIVGDNALFVVFNNTNELDNTSILNGIYITGGDASLGAYRWGAAIHNINASPTLTRCRIVGNRASGGGVVYSNNSSPQYFDTRCYANIGGGVQNANSPAVIRNCAFENNSSYGLSNYNSDVHITNSTFAANGSDGVINETSQVRFNDCQLTGNAGSGARAIFGSSLLFDSCSFSKNQQYGISADNSSILADSCAFVSNTLSGILSVDLSVTETLQLTHSSFISNGDGSVNGGAISANGHSKLILFSNDFRLNKGGKGGALYANKSVTAKITNSVFWHNLAVEGGAAYFKDCQASLYHASFAVNTASSGAAVSADGARVDMRNVIVWGNASVPLSEINGGVLEVNHATVEGGYAASTTIQTDNPLFIDMNYGELRHKGHSPIIDAGASVGVLSDILGQPRPLPVGGFEDLGAYERYIGIDVIGGFPVDNQDVVGLFSEFKLQFTEEISKGPAGGTIRLYYGSNLYEEFDVVSQVQIQKDTAIFIASKALKYGTYHIEISRDAFVGAVSGLGYYGTVSDHELNFSIHPQQLYVSPLAVGNASGHDWKNAFTDVQDALSAAVAGQEIWIAAGVFTPKAKAGGMTDNHRCFTLKDSVSLLGGFSGIPGTEADWSSRNIGKYVTVLSGDLSGNDDNTLASMSDNTFHIIRNSAAEGHSLAQGLRISGLQFVGANATGTGEFSTGAAIYMQGCSPSIDSCSFTANAAEVAIVYFGGGNAPQIQAQALLFTANNASFLLSSEYSALAISHSVARNNQAGFVSLIDTKLTATNLSIFSNLAESLFKIDGGQSTIHTMLMSTNIGLQGFQTSHDALLSLAHITTGGNTFSNKTLSASAETNLSVANSIFWANAPLEISTGSVSEYIDYNIISGGDARGDHNSGQDPLFYHPAVGNFAVIEHSPAIDNAVLSTSTEDIRGISRPQGLRSDIGAHERKSGPYIISSFPADDYFGSRTESISFHFSETIAPTSGSIFIKEQLSGKTVQTIDIAQLIFSGTEATAFLSTDVNFGSYYLIIDSAAIVSNVDSERVFDGIRDKTVLNFSFLNSIKYVNIAATGTNNGTSWEDAFVRVQDAIDACIAGDNIWIATGLYLPTSPIDVTDSRSYSFILKDHVRIFGGFSTLDYEFANRNTELYPTVLSGDLDGNDIADSDTYTRNGDNAYHVIFSNQAGLGNTVAINGCTIEGGCADGVLTEHQRGAGVFLQGDSIRFEHVVFRGNHSQSSGGAVYSNTYLDISESSFLANSSHDGGAICFAPAISASISVSNTVFTRNSAVHIGGAVSLSGASSDSRFLNIEFSSNSADYGSAVALSACTNPLFANILVHSNTALESGSIYSADGDVRLVNATISANNSGIDARMSGTVAVSNSIIWANLSSGVTQNHITSGSALIAFSHSTIGNADVSLVATNNNTDSDPRFVNPQAHNFLLQACSPAIDAGNNAQIAAFASFDLLQHLRISDGNGDGNAIVDMGAFEWDGVCLPAVCPAKYDACWTGCVDEDWFDAANWSSLAVPTSAEAVFVPGTAQVCRQPSIIGRPALCRSIDINAGGGALLQIYSDSDGRLITGPQ